MRKKSALRFWLSGLAALTATLFYLLPAAKGLFLMDVDLVLRVRADEPGFLELLVDEGSGRRRYFPADRSEDIRFPLPKGDIGTLRLAWGKARGDVFIQSLKLVTAVDSHRWGSDRLERAFHRLRGITTLETGGRGLRVSRTISGASMDFVPLFPDMINRLSHRKWPFLLFSPLLFLLVFLFAYRLDVSGLAAWFSRRSLASPVFWFLLLISFPLLNTLTRWVQPMPIQERRALAPRPELRLMTFYGTLKDYSRYIDDRFVFRNLFVHLNNRFRYFCFGVSDVPMVVAGKDGWLFMGRETPQRSEIDYYRRLKPFSREELDRWVSVLEARRRRLARRGAEYLFLVIPNKSTIYPEFMPDSLSPLDRPSRFDQLLKHLRLHSEVITIDLRPVLLAGKKDYPVYHRTDSHWTAFGAFLVYRKVLAHFRDLGVDVSPLPLERFRVERGNRIGGDLAAALTLEQKLRENMVTMSAEPPLTARTVERDQLSLYVTKSISRSPAGTLAAGLMVHDSFVHELRPFLAEHFKRMVWIWDWGCNYYPEVVEEENPWIVIDEMGERYLLDDAPSNLETRDGTFD